MLRDLWLPWLTPPSLVETACFKIFGSAKRGKESVASPPCSERSASAPSFLVVIHPLHSVFVSDDPIGDGLGHFIPPIGVPKFVLFILIADKCRLNEDRWHIGVGQNIKGRFEDVAEMLAQFFSNTGFHMLRKGTASDLVNIGSKVGQSVIHKIRFSIFTCRSDRG